MKKKKFQAKLAFASEFELPHPLTAAKNIISFGYGGEKICAMPRALRIKNLPKHVEPYKLLESKDCSIAIKAMNLSGGLKSERLLNADGEEVWYVAEGEGYCITLFGVLWFGAGDYVFIPRACAYRFQMLSPGNNLLIGMESESEFTRPNFGDFWNHDVPYPPEAVERPASISEIDAPDREGEWDVYVKRLGKLFTKITYPFSPFQNANWHGDLYPFLLHTRDINTLASPTVHLDPSAFATFISKDKSAVISTFKPRWKHSLPYTHMNHFDEFLFYASEYEARGGLVGKGDATFHPQGIWHGPQIEALANEKIPERTEDAPWSEEFAIMFESKKPLIVADIVLDNNIEIKDYWKSWHDGWEKHKEKF